MTTTPEPVRTADAPHPGWTPSRAAVAALVLASGFCALVYEVAWLRMLRLVFGASTTASASVLALFLGGLGAGGILVGRRADRAANPLRLYGVLEAGVAVSAAMTPLLVALVRRAYVLAGGTARLGVAGGTVVRILLAAAVLGPPTFLMGGTLPAAARAIEGEADAGRRDVGLLYGANTVGAVLGTLYATFLALEALGTNVTVWSACVLNVGLAIAAQALARPGPVTGSAPVRDQGPRAGVLVVAAAAVTGFVFLLMELVWYRMLAPLLGGSSYTLGLILAVALLGIGAGGLAYGAGLRARRPTLAGFATSCVLEALCLVVPFAVGDPIALLALVLRPVGFLGFGPLVLVWLVVTAVVVLPAAVVAGYQFPLLVGLLGRAGRGVGRDVGLAYAANTAGAILGALAGGFVLVPALGAVAAWRAAVLVLVGLAAACVGQALRARAPLRDAAVPVLLGVVVAALCAAEGPTAFWRHSAIGAGRLEVSFAGPDDYRRLLADRRRRIVWEADGIESPVALDGSDGYAFLINGKNDGNALGDAPTQVMAGLIGAALHGEPRTALVVGLGTGSTAGWLAQVPSIERVDVVELEGVVRHVAEVCAPVNHDVLRNPKVHLIVGDGREFLFTTSATYDLIVSEPSNPYRAGVASLFTREFYEAAAARLAPGGLFSQWLPAYEVDARTIRTVYATLAGVFPAVETWELKHDDLLLTARREAPAADVARLAATLEREPYRSALALVWGVSGVEGLYADYVADAGVATALRDAGAPINTDDRTVIEFEFARSVGRNGLFGPDALRELAAARGGGRPAFANGAPDWALTAELRTVRAVVDGRALDVRTKDAAVEHRVHARRAYVEGDLRGTQSQWLAQDGAPRSPMDTIMLAEALAATADPRAFAYVDEVRALGPSEAEALRARWEASAGRMEEAAAHLAAAFRGFRSFPWSYRPLIARSLELTWQLAGRRPDLGGALFDALAEPFAVRALDAQRVSTYVSVGLATDFTGRCVAAFAALEPHVPWERRLLEERERCYTLLHHPLAARARAELAAFQATSAPRLDEGLPSPHS